MFTLLRVETNASLAGEYERTQQPARGACAVCVAATFLCMVFYVTFRCLEYGLSLRSHVHHCVLLCPSLCLSVSRHTTRSKAYGLGAAPSYGIRYTRGKVFRPNSQGGSIVKYNIVEAGWRYQVMRGAVRYRNRTRSRPVIYALYAMRWLVHTLEYGETV